MQTKYFWPVVLVVTGALEESLRQGLVPAAWVPYVAPVVTFLAFLVRQR
jgi:hypothetical protein